MSQTAFERRFALSQLRRRLALLAKLQSMFGREGFLFEVLIFRLFWDAEKRRASAVCHWDAARLLQLQCLPLLILLLHLILCSYDSHFRRCSFWPVCYGDDSNPPSPAPAAQRECIGFPNELAISLYSDLDLISHLCSSVNRKTRLDQ